MEKQWSRNAVTVFPMISNCQDCLSNFFFVDSFPSFPAFPPWGYRKAPSQQLERRQTPHKCDTEDSELTEPQSGFIPFCSFP